MANDKYSLTYKAIDELDTVTDIITTGTCSLVIMSGSQPFRISIANLVSLIHP